MEMWKERMCALRIERRSVFVRNIGEQEDGNPKNKMEALEKLVWVLSPTEAVVSRLLSCPLFLPLNMNRSYISMWSIEIIILKGPAPGFLRIWI